MDTTPKFDESFKRLNPEQREAVECLDGPLLVIAGPGTGKTQLLSLRAANIPLSLIGGADVASELDAKRAIDQGTRLAAAL